MTEIELEEDENVDLLTVLREEMDDTTLLIIYKWEILDMPVEHHDKIMNDALLQVMQERGIQPPTVLPNGEVDYGKYEYLKDYDFATVMKRLEMLGALETGDGSIK